MKQLLSSILVITCYITTTYTTLHMPLQTYKAMEQEAWTLAHTRSHIVKRFHELEKSCRQDKDCYELLDKINQWKQNKQLFDRAMKWGKKVGIIDKEQAFRLRIIVNVPRSSPLSLEQIAAILSSYINHMA